MLSLEQIYQYNINLLKKAQVPFEQWEHEPILDFETDARIAKALGWTAAPTKSLFLKLKGGNYCVFLTHRDQRLDAKLIKNIIGKRPAIGNDTEMTEVTGCVPGALCPFGLSSEIPLIVDPLLTTFQDIMYTPGKPEMTIAFAGAALPNLLEHLENQTKWLTDISV